MLDRSFLFVASCALVWSALCTVPALSSDKQPEKKRWEELRDKPIDYSPYERRRAENLKLGARPITRALAAGFAKVADLGTLPVLTDPDLNRGLEVEVSKLLPANLGLKPPPIEFVIVDDLGLLAEIQAAGQDSAAIQAILAKEATNFTAASTGGGAIIIGLSVLKTVKTYDELDFLLSHEASHILYDHFTEDERNAKIHQAINVVALIAVLATRRADADTREAAAWTALGLMVANSLLGPAWDREQEQESDELGYELLMESNRSADGATNILEKFQKRDDALKAHLDLLCGTDSAVTDFLKRVVGSYFGIPIPREGYDPNNPVCQERRNIFASLFKGHPETKERKKYLEKYHKVHYAARPDIGLKPIGDGSGTLLDFFSPNGDTNRALRAYDGITAFHKGDLATAKRFAQAIPSKGQAENQLPILELNFYIANAEGRRAEALQFLDKATLVPEPSLRHSQLAEREYAKDQKWADAARVLRMRITRQIGDLERNYPLWIMYLRLASKTVEMDRALLECRALNRPGMTLACEAMAHPQQIGPPPAPPK